MSQKTHVLCSWCIQGIRSHGDKVWVGDLVTDDDAVCDICKEEANPDEPLYEVIWE